MGESADSGVKFEYVLEGESGDEVLDTACISPAESDILGYGNYEGWQGFREYIDQRWMNESPLRREGGTDLISYHEIVEEAAENYFHHLIRNDLVDEEKLRTLLEDIEITPSTNIPERIREKNSDPKDLVLTDQLVNQLYVQVTQKGG